MNQRLPASVRKATFLRVRITTDEMRAIKAAARKTPTRRVSDWVRAAILARLSL